MTGHVCAECRQTLDWAKRERRRPLANGLKVWQVPRVPHVLRYIHAGDLDAQEAFTKAFWALLVLVCRNVVEETRYAYQVRSKLQEPKKAAVPLRDATFENIHVGVLTDEEQQAFDACFRSVEALAKSAYAQGFDRGANMLERLMRGEVTCEQINEAARNNKG